MMVYVPEIFLTIRSLKNPLIRECIMHIYPPPGINIVHVAGSFRSLHILPKDGKGLISPPYPLLALTFWGNPKLCIQKQNVNLQFDE